LNTAGLVFGTKPNWNRKLKPKIPRTCRRQVVRPLVQAAARYRLLKGIRLRAEPSRWCHPAHGAKPDECLLVRLKLNQVVRLHRLSVANQCRVQRENLKGLQHLRDARQVVRLYRSSGAKAN